MNIKEYLDILKDLWTPTNASKIRMAINNALEMMGNNLKENIDRQDNVENQFQDVLDETTGKDVINGPEIIAARNGEANLKARLDKEKNEVTAQLAQKATATNYYYPTVDIKAVDGTGDFDADTITVAEIHALFDDLVRRFPHVLSSKTLGLDESGLYEVKAYDYIINTPGDYIFVDGAIHGNSSDGDPKDVAIALYYFLKDLCENTDTNDKLAEIDTKTNFSIIPIVNPWGFNNNSRLNSNGVDLNRNFSFNWKSDTTSGSSAFSEKETQYVRDRLIEVQSRTRLSNHKILAYIPFHNYANRGIRPMFPFVASATSPLASVLNNVSKHLSNKYGYAEIEGIVPSGSAASADNFAERILGIPSGTPEFPIYRNDGNTRNAYAMTQQVEFYGNLIYQSLNLNTKSKLKRSVFELSEQVDIPVGESALKALTLKSTENIFEFDSETGEIIIPTGTEFIQVKAQVTIRAEETGAFPMGVYIKKNNWQYDGYTLEETLVHFDKTNSRGLYKTFNLETPVIHCAPGDKIRFDIYNGSDVALKTAPSLKATWLYIKEENMYK